MRSDIVLVLGGIGLVKCRIRHPGLLVEITKEINPFLIQSNFLANAPFKLINGVIRFGTKFDPHAKIGPVSRRHNELPLSVEIDVTPLNRAPREVVKAEFLRALIPALFAISKKYKLPDAGLIACCEHIGVALPLDQP